MHPPLMKPHLQTANAFQYPFAPQAFPYPQGNSYRYQVMAMAPQYQQNQHAAAPKDYYQFSQNVQQSYDHVIPFENFESERYPCPDMAADLATVFQTLPATAKEFGPNSPFSSCYQSAEGSPSGQSHHSSSASPAITQLKISEIFDSTLKTISDLKTIPKASSTEIGDLLTDSMLHVSDDVRKELLKVLRSCEDPQPGSSSLTISLSASR